MRPSRTAIRTIPICIIATATPIRNRRRQVGGAACKYPIGPTLQDGRHAEPPDGKLQDQEVGTPNLVPRGYDIGSQRAGHVGHGLLRRDVEQIRVGALALEVVRANHGSDAHGVEVADQDIVSGAAQRLDGNGLHRRVERPGFGVGTEDQDIRGRTKMSPAGRRENSSFG